MSKKYQKYVFSPLDYYRNKYQVICGGDLRDKTFFEKKIVQNSFQNDVQKWISKAVRKSSKFCNESHVDDSNKNFGAKLKKSDISPRTPKHTLNHV